MFCTACGTQTSCLILNEKGDQVCTDCRSKDFKRQTYNKKAFLVPDSSRSMSCYHAKINDDGTYRFTMHDCHNSIRLRGDLKSKVETYEAINKLHALEDALKDYREFIVEHYTYPEP